MQGTFGNPLPRQVPSYYHISGPSVRNPYTNTAAPVKFSISSSTSNAAQKANTRSTSTSHPALSARFPNPTKSLVQCPNRQLVEYLQGPVGGHVRLLIYSNALSLYFPLLRALTFPSSRHLISVPKPAIILPTLLPTATAPALATSPSAATDTKTTSEIVADLVTEQC